jgi:hypothetical protein
LDTPGSQILRADVGERQPKLGQEKEAKKDQKHERLLKRSAMLEYENKR